MQRNIKPKNSDKKKVKSHFLSCQQLLRKTDFRCTVPLYGLFSSTEAGHNHLSPEEKCILKH